MQVRTKKPHIEKQGVIRLVLIGPRENEGALMKAATGMGFSESIPWREAFSEYSENELPGVVLSGARHKEGLTQKELAEKLDINQGYLSDLECGKRAIGKNMAKKLAATLKVNYKIFL